MVDDGGDLGGAIPAGAAGAGEIGHHPAKGGGAQARGADPRMAGREIVLVDDAGGGGHGVSFFGGGAAQR